MTAEDWVVLTRVVTVSLKPYPDFMVFPLAVGAFSSGAISIEAVRLAEYRSKSNFHHPWSHQYPSSSSSPLCHTQYSYHQGFHTPQEADVTSSFSGTEGFVNPSFRSSALGSGGGFSFMSTMLTSIVPSRTEPPP